MLARKRVHGYGLMRTVNPSQVRSGSCKTKKPKHCSQWACAHVSKKSLLSSSHLSLRYVENKKTGPWSQGPITYRDRFSARGPLTILTIFSNLQAKIKPRGGGRERGLNSLPISTPPCLTRIPQFFLTVYGRVWDMYTCMFLTSCDAQ